MKMNWLTTGTIVMALFLAVFVYQATVVIGRAISIEEVPLEDASENDVLLRVVGTRAV